MVLSSLGWFSDPYLRGRIGGPAGIVSLVGMPRTVLCIPVTATVVYCVYCSCISVVLLKCATLSIGLSCAHLLFLQGVLGVSFT